MKYQDFLILENTEESSYRTSISYDDAVDIFIKNCKDMDVNNHYCRAARAKFDASILEGQKGNRKSISNYNYHNIVIDHQITTQKLNYPLRSKSIIAIGSKGTDIMKKYGPNHYAIFPFDGVTIMRCDDEDILEMNSYKKYSVDIVSTILNMYIDVDHVDSFEELVDLLYKHNYQKDDHFYNELNDKSKEEIGKFLEGVFTLKKFDVVTTKTDDTNHTNEVWIGGKCLVINFKLLDQFRKDVMEKLKNEI